MGVLLQHPLDLLAYRRDTSGEYLFSGYSTQVQPFSSGASGVAYSGDQGARMVQISATQKVADGLNGAQVFMQVPEGNGTFSVSTGVSFSIYLPSEGVSSSPRMASSVDLPQPDGPEIDI